ncbi:MAG: Phosphoglucomutase [candidate division BRC1 bacterium ADurb.BinA292]|nr:MAG: Phosphoglucomutase [candidate division BRC1 bacterium ADurb.BinA292]
MNHGKLDLDAILSKAEQGITAYLDAAKTAGHISPEQHKTAMANTLPNLREWLTSPKIDELSPNLKAGVADAVEAGRWEDLVNAYRQSMRFGTGGIRGMMAFDRESIRKLAEDGLDARILKGPNTLNNVVLLRTSAGVAQFGKQAGRNFDRIVIGYDSRVRGGDFARLIAELFLAYDYTVYLFDEPCPYPMVTFAIPHERIKAHVGILISASHNDYRYNGYKLSCGNGSQFDPKERDEMYERYIAKATFDDIRLRPLSEAPRGKLYWLGGAEPVAGVDYFGREDALINIHELHAAHVRGFLMTRDFSGMEPPLRIGYCPFHGAGRKAVPRLLNDIGLTEIQRTTRNGLYELNGMFPSFCNDPGKEQQPDPGDPRAARIAVDAFKAEYPGDFEKLDILIGTDPDADRCGVVVKVPENQRRLHGGQDWMLLPADDMWGLLLWYRFHREAEAAGGRVPDADKKFAVLSHTTTDAIVRLCRKFGVGVIKTWVGFAALSAAVRDQWDKVPQQNLVDGRVQPDDPLCHPYICQYIDMHGGRTINIGSMEQSNGFSLLGGPPPDPFSLGVNGHVRDKDGVFAAILSAEVAAWAKQQGTSLFELVDRHIYLDPAIGLFVNHYEPDPLDGEYPGIEGDRKKIGILKIALDLYRAQREGKPVHIGGKDVVAAVMYRTGKYDRIYPPADGFVFPDEGVRLFFSADRLDHLTIRPSGTGNSLRFHIQLHSAVEEANLIEKKAELRRQAAAIADHIREILGAPR